MELVALEEHFVTAEVLVTWLDFVSQS